jgi:hypothetical protein
MPTYTFRDTGTGEVFDVFLSLRDYDIFKQEHPECERYYDADSIPSLVSGVSVTGKSDDGFKEVLSKISEAHPNSPLADSNVRKTIKQSQTERIVRKWKSTTGGIT